MNSIPLTPEERAATQEGIKATIRAVTEALLGKGDGKVYHQYPVGSSEELHFHMGCKWAAERLMKEQMQKETFKKKETK